MTSLERFAPAKVNLFLHVGPLAADGYHPISSLITFASVGDVVRMAPAEAMSFAVEGPFAAELEASAGDNLVIQARDAVLGAFEGTWSPFRLTLQKNLPVAAGLGGGSSDASAALNLLTEALSLRDAGEVLAEIARKLGSDVPACLGGVPAMAYGRGDACEAPPAFPELDAVLVNPLEPSPTAAVYRAYDEAGAPGSAEPPSMQGSMDTPRSLGALLAETTRNDLQAPAIALTPVIGDVLAALQAQPQTLFARMSGSGASCFAICADPAAARGLAAAISNDHPGWWVRGCRLKGFRP